MARSASVRILMITLAAACSVARAAPVISQSSTTPTDSTGAHPLNELVRSAVRRYRPAVLREARGRTSYVWLLADGRGRVTRTAVDTRRPRADALRDVLREKFPEVDTDAWMRRVPEALFPMAGVSRFRPGEIGPDTVLVFWAEPPTPLGSEPPSPRGVFLFGRAAAAQFSPPRVRQAARKAGPGQTVWFVQDASGTLLDVGVYDGGRDYEAIRALLRPRYPGRRLQCSAGFALPDAGGRLVPTVAVRLGTLGS